jgi:drug/metabolite transporter (DMT)-like permease
MLTSGWRNRWHVYSAVLGWLVFGELPGIWSCAGMALIVASSLYLVLNERRPRPR